MGRVRHEDAPAAPRKPGDSGPETETRWIAFTLTAEELAERSQEAAELLAERDRTEAAYKTKASEERKRVGGMDVKLRRLNRIVLDREETRPVECEVRIDRRSGKVDVVRTDSGEVVETRALTAEERQTEVPGS